MIHGSNRLQKGHTITDPDGRELLDFCESERFLRKYLGKIGI